MHTLDFPKIHSPLQDVVVEFIQKGCCSKFGTGEVGQRVCNQAIGNGAYEQVQQQGYHQNYAQHGGVHFGDIEGRGEQEEKIDAA